MKARVIVSVEDTRKLMEFRYVIISPTVAPDTIHIRNERNVLIRNESFSRTFERHGAYDVL